ncbi:hypothetical protein BT96DRAFT_222680 [Gymnopus androsaceus JB14]|uniref:Uncharacterized protein n=1 Tax=Gymnopus androsaceus JB14 TaxID=1447944 RepID=A0A6A4I9D0_9AGAR|nr:hypothetical protein BT96DRAFT_222680 [Gymnopus androsaceus JB14]
MYLLFSCLLETILSVFNLSIHSSSRLQSLLASWTFIHYMLSIFLNLPLYLHTCNFVITLGEVYVMYHYFSHST